MPANFNRIITAVILLIVVIVGGVIVILQPSTLSFSEYLKDVSLGAGLLGIGYGIDAGSRP